MPITKLRKRVDGRLTRLTTRRRDLPARHRSLLASLEESWDALSPAAQRALASLSVFRGGMTLELAEAMLEDVAGEDPQTEDEPLDLLQELRNKSLLRALTPDDLPNDETRLAFYESVRQFGAEKLEALGANAVEVARSTHARLVLDYAEELADADGQHLDRADARSRRARLRLEGEGYT